jgi:glyoxylase-like metal-dependent hydrolase (beta-lactamase superfamily II)
LYHRGAFAAVLNLDPIPDPRPAPPLGRRRQEDLAMPTSAARSLPRLAAALAALSLLALPVAAPPAAAQDEEDRFANVEIETVPVADGVWMLVGAGGNIGVSAGEDGVFLVDDQYAPLTAKIRAAVAKIHPGPIRFVLNTHWHGDHTGGNENLGETGAVIVAHENVRKTMSVDQVLSLFGSTVPASPEAALPVITFPDEITFHLNGQEILVHHVPPSHTDGDSVVHFRGAEVLHTGDVYFNGTYPFIDVEHGGSIDTMAAVAAKLASHLGEGAKVIPGHGPLSNRAELAAYAEMLRGVSEAVAAEIAEGKDRDAVVAAKPTAPWDEPWGQGFVNGDTFAGIVYDSLTAAAERKGAGAGGARHGHGPDGHAMHGGEEGGSCPHCGMHGKKGGEGKCPHCAMHGKEGGEAKCPHCAMQGEAGECECPHCPMKAGSEGGACPHCAGKGGGQHGGMHHHHGAAPDAPGGAEGEVAPPAETPGGGEG